MRQQYQTLLAESEQVNPFRREIIHSDLSDFSLNEAGNNQTAVSETIRVGKNTNSASSPDGRNAVFIFELPSADSLDGDVLRAYFSF